MKYVELTFTHCHCRVFVQAFEIRCGVTSYVAGLPKRFFYVMLEFSLSGNSLHGAVEAMIVAWWELNGWAAGLRSKIVSLKENTGRHELDRRVCCTHVS